ncbi:MAG: hypothetical protein CMF96_02220 [Candidatus Marinimicrobia bacterium]|nr:hypothetical protein [Candidatus Neomarinimicrobiota bacterium]|tara:strand:+ start:1263 stop:1739 length:477 start_codon:yes stop_codon:yes gene_type:complete
MQNFTHNKHILFFITFIVFSFSIEIGIESFEQQKDGTFLADVYMINEVPLAGFQLDLLPKDYFEIISITGGNGEKSGFNMSAGKKGTMLGFSFSGAVIEPSKSNKISKNILFTLSLKPLKPINDKTEISFNPIMAGRGGEKVTTTVIPFKPLMPKNKK